MAKTKRRIDFQYALLYNDWSVRQLISWTSRSNPAPSYRQKWRREQRVKIKQQMQRVLDWDDAVIETRMTRLTDRWDWY